MFWLEPEHGRKERPERVATAPGWLGNVVVKLASAWDKNTDFPQLPPINITDKRFCGQPPDRGKKPQR
jgi:hypothetical protein